MNRIKRLFLVFVLMVTVLCCGGSTPKIGKAAAPKPDMTQDSRGDSLLLLSVAQVQVSDNDGKSSGIGTGFAVDLLSTGETLMVTAGHVCGKEDNTPHDNIAVHTALGMHAEGEIIWFNIDPDICVFKVKTILPPYPLEPVRVPKFDDKLTSIQSPFGIFPTRRYGTFNFVHKDTGDYFISMLGATGSSGSPIVKDGTIVGMVTMIVSADGRQGDISICEPSPRIVDFVRQTKEIMELRELLDGAINEASIE